MTKNNLPDAEKLLAALTAQMRPQVTPQTGLIGIVTGGAWLAERLHQAGLLRRQLGGEGWQRVVVEKPFGHDLPSARHLNAALTQHLSIHVFAELQFLQTLSDAAFV